MAKNILQEAYTIVPPIDLLESYPDLKHAANDLALRYAHNELVVEQQLQVIGDRLWQTLDCDEAFATAHRSAGLAVLPIIIESDDPAIQQLPWETLHHPQHGFLGCNPTFTLSRRIPSSTGAAAPVEKGPLRVLLFTSLPDDLDAEKSRLNVEDEQAQVQEALLPLVSKGAVELEMPDDGRFSTLKQQLQHYRPHLVYLSGHGKFYHQPHSDEPPYGTFLFEGEAHGSNPVRENEVARAFIGTSVQCVVLSACESGSATSDALNNGLTRRLSDQGVPHVIGMRESVLDQAGILFAHHFCAAIGDEERVDAALQQGRQAITRPFKEGMRRDEMMGDGRDELSYGQWCLPTLISRDVARPLIDWAFEQQPITQRLANRSLSTITLPPRFFGRRSELRELQGRIRKNRLQQLLITGPGGQGKTALAGKLVSELHQRGYEILAWSARPENHWSDFLFELKLQLSDENGKRYDRALPELESERQRASLLLRLLLNQNQQRVVLFFDNLESIQQLDSLQLTDPRVTDWIKAAQELSQQGVVLLLTSRWQLPEWPESDHWPLEHCNYGDFLRLAQQQQFPQKLIRTPGRMRSVYDTLHGNARGLEFYAAAIRGMASQEEADFQAKLAQAETEIQADMALELIIQRLDDEVLELLQRLPAYKTPVPLEGVIKVALDLPGSEQSLQRLLSLSLVERRDSQALYETVEYQVSPLVEQWLQKNRANPPTLPMLKTAADFQLYLFRNEKRALTQAIVAHQALELASEQVAADQLVLDVIIGPLNRQGLYQTLLERWLPPVSLSKDSATKAEALGQIGKQHLHLGDYDTALQYLKRSLAIRQEIGDKSGEGTTLNNISQIYDARG
ncbi:MAG: CHAT domain-containing protein, partial [Sedimenticola sp.]